jgi:hypothetical protein
VSNTKEGQYRGFNGLDFQKHSGKSER